MPVGAAFGATGEDSRLRIPPDDLTPAEAAAVQADLDVVAPAGELGGDGVGEDAPSGWMPLVQASEGIRAAWGLGLVDEPSPPECPWG